MDTSEQEQAIDYSDSTLRQIIAWLIYPICVGGPVAMAVVFMQQGDPGKAFMMLPIFSGVSNCD